MVGDHTLIGILHVHVRLEQQHALARFPRPDLAPAKISQGQGWRETNFMRPILDLNKNWDVDVATQLEEYLAEVRPRD